MANKKFGWGMLAVALVFGMMVVGCGGSGDGSSTSGSEGSNPSGGGGYFTLTNIPAEYNGKYVYLDDGEDESGYLGILGFNYDAKTDTYTNVPISNGSAKIPIWTDGTGDSDYVRYSGSHTFAFQIIIFDSEEDGNQLICGDFYSVKFTNGNATKSWSDADEIYPPKS